LGAAFLRAVRFTALRSDLSVIDFVFAMLVFFLCCECVSAERRKRTSAAKAGSFRRLGWPG
jgi:hypothetical protein